jgi:enoyl-CoA hydratase/carnithine racemase
MIDIIAHDSLVEIKLNRVPVNALNYELLNQLVLTLEQVIASDAKGIVLSGGQKVFSGGLDVPYLLQCNASDLKACWSRFFDAARTIAKSPIPVAAAIAGHNPAGGCVLALCCDYRVMADGPYRIGLNETQVGLAVPDAIQYLLRRIVGAHRAERLVVAGAMVESQKAYELGIVDELSSQDSVVDKALAWLKVTATLPQGPMLATRALARADIIKALNGFNDAEMTGFMNAWYSEETQIVLKNLFIKK